MATTQVNGAVVVSNAQALANASSGPEAAIAPTPILTASQAGIPSALRYTDHTDLGPRIGFAWRPYGKDTTVLRGGWGRFIESPLGFSLVSGWAVPSSYVGTYNQDYQSDGVTPLLNFQIHSIPLQAAPRAPRASITRFRSTTRSNVQQWNLTLEQDLATQHRHARFLTPAATGRTSKQWWI